MWNRALLLSVLVVFFSSLAAADELLIAAAADLRFALQDIVRSFEKKTGNSVKVSYGSSGNFYNLIQNGAPYDLFFSADTAYAQKLEAAGRAAPGSFYEYATGKLVLWAPRNSALDLTRGVEVVLDPRVRKIAVANPTHAPYGRAAVSAMQSAGVYDRVKAKLVTGENISQTAEFVSTGNADVGFVSLSLALSPNMTSRGRYIEVSAKTYPPIRQAAVIMRSSKRQVLARQFLDYIKSAESLDVLRKYGFTVPTSARK